LVCAQHC